MYSIAILFYSLCVKIVALCGHKKARQMVRGQRATWQYLKQNLEEGKRYVWFHAASLGEFEQGRPLMERLRKEHPEYGILLTFFSPSGYEVRKNYEGADLVCYLPFDTMLHAHQFVKLVNPVKAYFIKYEFWRNYIEQLHKSGAELYSVSSIFRPEQVFFQWYGRGYARCLRLFTHIFVQNEESAQLLEKIGVKQTTVVGDTRFDRVMDIQKAATPLPIVERFAGVDNVLVAGSSWSPDEDILIDYFNRHPLLKLVLAPHVVSEEHLREIEGKLRRPCLRYSQATPKSAVEAECLIIDGYGLLSSIYRYGNVAYIGGGFGVGIHNVPEAAVYGVPVVFGPNNKRFQEAQFLLQIGGAFEVKNAEDFAKIVNRLLKDKAFRTSAGQKAGHYISDNAGAADSIYEATMHDATK